MKDNNNRRYNSGQRWLERMADECNGHRRHGPGDYLLTLTGLAGMAGFFATLGGALAMPLAYTFNINKDPNNMIPFAIGAVAGASLYLLSMRKPEDGRGSDFSG